MFAQQFAIPEGRFEGDWDGMFGYELPNRIDWNAIINQGFAIGSQAINSYSGAHSGTQIGYNPTQGGIFAIQQQQPTGNNQAYNPYAGWTPQQIATEQQRQASLGGGLGSGLDGIIQWAGNNPMIVFGGILAAFLLFKEPPRSRR